MHEFLIQHDENARDPGVASQYMCAVVGCLLGETGHVGIEKGGSSRAVDGIYPPCRRRHRTANARTTAAGGGRDLEARHELGDLNITLHVSLTACLYPQEEEQHGPS